MFDDVTIRVADRYASVAFYSTVLATLGIQRTGADAEFTRWGGFSVAAAGEGRPPTRGLHLGFVAPSREHVDAFWRAGVGAGHRDDGSPGPRPQYRPEYYGAFLLDPDGNSAEAVHHDVLREGGPIDHVWIRVADVPAATRCYEAIAPDAGFTVGSADAERAWFRGPTTGSFSLVAGEPTENVDIVFGTGGDVSLHVFHRSDSTVEVVHHERK
jgi:catechol 2,3-dioxygenase-like lactoylglutathione lyase family enzyme